mmetsp:Transcript_33973/g.38222  ORF Transcript_33973/g.38222 Transcript_33973/m.38222 type:complete len:216 (-) Transcript_33973:327-974(-)
MVYPSVNLPPVVVRWRTGNFGRVKERFPRHHPMPFLFLPLFLHSPMYPSLSSWPLLLHQCLLNLFLHPPIHPSFLSSWHLLLPPYLSLLLHLCSLPLSLLFLLLLLNQLSSLLFLLLLLNQLSLLFLLLLNQLFRLNQCLLHRYQLNRLCLLFLQVLMNRLLLLSLVLVLVLFLRVVRRRKKMSSMDPHVPIPCPQINQRLVVDISNNPEHHPMI